MNKEAGQIAASYMQLIPLLYRAMDNPNDEDKEWKAPAEITHLQVHILEELYQHPDGIAMTPLSRLIRVSKQQLTPLVAKLEEKGYVSKHADASDKRIVRLRLAEKGQQLVNERWGNFHHGLVRRMEGLNGEDRSDLAYAIEKLTHILRRLPT
ncbi:MarR family transcriptional regulator [Paenibacillus lycopersici]|uniref:MarR family transcriptional regulator n=1 Tax=Paenibacillus lycopersici TaxID=2704462 RepID=A0A6C0G0U7_9BACL|nr:MarR family transcriptional regulator [Paenibacillus lycopersici]QHT61493.1 MarR family transcriptional regulator [Paenibacillus lycopersici]